VSSGVVLDSGVKLVYIMNWLILSAIVIVGLYVCRDARRRGRSWLEAVAWMAVSIFTFPIGAGLYFLLKRRQKV
jgi:hypothetical protein